MEVITTHTNADFDAMASMLAAKKLYPDAVVAFSGSQEQGLRDFFVQSTFYAFDFAKIKDVDFDRVTRLILVDIRDPNRIGPFKKLLNVKNLEIHVYDHHPLSDGDIRGDIEHIADVGATVTIFVEILREREISITPDEATILMLASTKIPAPFPSLPPPPGTSRPRHTSWRRGRTSTSFRTCSPGS